MRRGSGRFVAAIAVALIAVVGYFLSTEVVRNPFTGEDQRVALNQEEEIALGLQAAPHMAEQFGGLAQDPTVQETVERVGRRLVARTAAADTPYEFQFAVLADAQTVNAFALPGGPVFITRAMFDMLDVEAELAGILAHEIGHVVGRHSSEQIAKQQLLQQLGLAGAILVADEDGSGNQRNQQLALLAAQLASLRFTREHETESDGLAVQIMADAGYDPRRLIDVMEKLKASGGPRQPEFFSSHPDPDNRVANIHNEIDRRFPDGVPDGLEGGP